MTMAKVREIRWVPMQITSPTGTVVKGITGDCWGCKRLRIQAYQSPPPGNLPSTRNQRFTPFEVPGVNFAGPIPYRTKGKAARKTYLALYE